MVCRVFLARSDRVARQAFADPPELPARRARRATQERLARLGPQGPTDSQVRPVLKVHKVHQEPRVLLEQRGSPDLPALLRQRSIAHHHQDRSRKLTNRGPAQRARRTPLLVYRVSSRSARLLQLHDRNARQEATGRM